MLRRTISVALLAALAAAGVYWWLSAPVGIANWPLKRSIYSLGDLRALLAAAIRRYLEFVGQLEDRVPGPQLTTDSESARSRNHSGFASGASNIKRQPSTSNKSVTGERMREGQIILRFREIGAKA